MRTLGFLLPFPAARAILPPMKIAILGAGALGSFYGARLAQAGEDVTFIVRSSYNAIREHGLQVQSVDGDMFLPRAKVCRRAADCGPVDLVVLCWKAFYNDQLADSLPPLLHEGTQVVSLQNGMGNAEAVSAFVPPEDVFVGLCFVCCMADSPGVVRHLEGGDIQFAPFRGTDSGYERACALAEQFRAAGIRTTAYRDLEYIQWHKLIWNIPFNGLCLVHGGISVRELFTMPQEVQRAREIMDEVCAAAKLRGFPLPAGLADNQMRRTAGMGDFIPSSAMDFLRKRQVEYDAIWGTPLRRALEAGAHVPAMSALCAEIRQCIGKE